MSKLQKKTPAKGSAVPVQQPRDSTPPVAPAKLPPLPREALEPLRAEAEEWIRNVMVEYAAPTFPEMGTKWLGRLLCATTRKEAEYLAKKAITHAHLELLMAWRNHRIRGPINSTTAETRAKAAEDLATMLDKKGQREQAESQRARAAEIRFEAKLLREGAQG